MKVAIVHELLIGYGGAERVLEDILKVYSEAVVYTMIYLPDKMPERFRQYEIRTTYFQKIPMAEKLYKKMVPLMPGAWERLDLTEYDLVISSCNNCCKGVIVAPYATHVCYCHTPPRYYWDMFYEYRKDSGRFMKLILPGLIHKMRMWDRLAADRVDYFVANSEFTAARIKKYYRRESEVIYPGVHINDCEIVEEPEDYYLVVSRFVAYKRVDLAIKACNKLGRRLVIIGGRGEAEKELYKIAGDTIEFKGHLPDEEVWKYYIHAKAFLFPGKEDFGITPVEAQSAGVPVLAFAQGGALETVIDGKTGRYFFKQTEDALIECMKSFEEQGVAYSRSEIREHSLKFSDERFRREVEKFINEVCN